MDIPIQSPWFRRAPFPAFFPLRIFDRHFWDQWDSEFYVPFYSLFYYQPYFWHHQSLWDTGTSEVRTDKDRFLINLDLKHFIPEELSVTVSDEYVNIHGKHKEWQDEHGYAAREFFRKCKMPAGVDPKSFTACLSSDGVLSVCAPRNLQDLTEQCAIPIACDEKVSASK